MNSNKHSITIITKLTVYTTIHGIHGGGNFLNNTPCQRLKSPVVAAFKLFSNSFHIQIPIINPSIRGGVVIG